MDNANEIHASIPRIVDVTLRHPQGAQRKMSHFHRGSMRVKGSSKWAPLQGVAWPIGQTVRVAVREDAEHDPSMSYATAITPAVLAALKAEPLATVVVVNA